MARLIHLCQLKYYIVTLVPQLQWKTPHHRRPRKLREDDQSRRITAHTTNLVHAIYVAADHADYTVADGKLADVAPTLLDMMGVQPSAEMTGKSMLVKK